VSGTLHGGASVRARAKKLSRIFLGKDPVIAIEHIDLNLASCIVYIYF